MSVIIVLILASLFVGLVFLCAFIWSVRSGQYEDTLTPSLRVLAEDDFIKAGDNTVPVPVLQQIPERKQMKQHEKIHKNSRSGRRANRSTGSPDERSGRKFSKLDGQHHLTGRQPDSF